MVNGQVPVIPSSSSRPLAQLLPFTSFLPRHPLPVRLLGPRLFVQNRNILYQEVF